MNVVDEYLAAMRAMSVEDVRQLMGYGISIRSVVMATPVPVRIKIGPGDVSADRYGADPDGHPAWVLPVRVVDPERPEAIEAIDPIEAISAAPIVDLVAFHPDAPGRWAVRCGNAVVLGAIDPQHCLPDPVSVHRDVSAWLRAECRGIVLLTRDPHEAARILRQIDCIAAEDDRHRAELRTILEAIQLGPRVRRDLGDIQALADSIAAIGLLHSIVVAPDGALLAGHRRLEACRLLGWQRVPVNVVEV